MAAIPAGSAADAQARFGQSVKGLLTEKATSCGTDVIALTKQVLKGSRSAEFLGQAARNMVMQEDAILHSEDSLRKMAIITTHLQYQQEAIQKKNLFRYAAGEELEVSYAQSYTHLPEMSEQIYKEVQDYYGKELKKTEDLKTNACITAARPLPIFVREALQCVHEEVSAKYYGCGLVIPECIEGCWVLDLGSGSGRDCYVLSKLVGENGHVTGVDMTETQVDVAKKHIKYHMNKFGYQKSNVNFIHGYIEKLGEAGLKDESYDLVISNCVVNLSPDKRTVLREAFRMLKAGGELYFSDVYASHDLSEDIRKHRVLWGECLGGALWWKDLYKIADEVGFSPPRLVTASRITLANKELESIVGDCQFVSATFRLFKIPKDGSIQQCEIIYKGGIAGHEKEFAFDVNYNFKQGEVVEVDGETASVLRHSRFAKKFLISPVEQKLPACEGHSPGTIKEKIADPFKLVEQTEAKVSAKSPSGCFGPKRCC